MNYSGVPCGAGPRESTRVTVASDQVEVAAWGPVPLEEEKQHGDCSLWLFQDNEITLGVVTNDSEPAVKAVDHIR